MLKTQMEQLVLKLYRGHVLYSEAVREFKKRYILVVLSENKWNQCKAARDLGMHRNTLARTVRELGMDLNKLRLQEGHVEELREKHKIQPYSVPTTPQAQQSA